MRIFKGKGDPVTKIMVKEIGRLEAIPEGWHDTKGGAWGLAPAAVPKPKYRKKAAKPRG